MLNCLRSQLDFDGVMYFSKGVKKPPKMKNLDVVLTSSYISPILSYQRFAVQGFLKKEVKEAKLFQKKKKYKRYFVMDHNAKKMRIHQSNDPTSEYKLFNYTDILEVIEPVQTVEERMKIRERWTFNFIVVTKQREFVLFAASNDERELWLHTFNWIVECNAFSNALIKSKTFHA